MKKKILSTISGVLFNKSFALGAVLSFGMFSQYIFGPNNLAEEAAEFVHKMATGVDIDYSPHVPEKDFMMEVR